MKRFPGRTVIRHTLFVFALLCAKAGSAEPLIPKHFQYEFEVKQDSAGKVCHLLLLLINIPAPEVINLKLVAGKSSQGHVAFFGLIFDVGDMTFVNGLPSKTAKTPLFKASFDSKSFSSTGRLNGGPVDDGGVMLSTVDPATGGSLFASFLSGQFSISFVRKGELNTRTYVISQPPPVDVKNQFSACIATLQ